MHGHMLLLCLIQAVASFISLEPKNATVLRGRDVNFICSTNESWDVMTWLLMGRSVLSISAQHGPLGRDESVSVVNRSTALMSLWELILHNASFIPTVQDLMCDLLPSGRASSSLFVQEKGSVRIVEDDLSVPEGTLIIFHCQAFGWYPEPSMSWMVNESIVNEDYNTSTIQDPTSFLFNSSSKLQIKAENSVTLQCWASVSAPLSLQTSTVRITVEAPDMTPDYTVLIAVVASVCTVILLALVILLLCHRKKLSKSSSENKSRSSHESRSADDETRGKVNMGYHAEDLTSPGHSDLGNRAGSRIHGVSILPRHPICQSWAQMANTEAGDWPTLAVTTANKSLISFPCPLESPVLRDERETDA
ncbi:hypothetical protein DNTS_004945, partial [Danionella cerebrum]